MRYFILLLLLLFFVPATMAQTESLKDGPALYKSFCANCHGALEKTRVPNRSRARIASAIEYFAIMNDLDNLTEQELDLISSSLRLN